MDLNAIQSALDYYKKFTPVNFVEERRTFFEQVKKGRAYNPRFVYRDAMSAVDYIDIQKRLKRRMGRDAVIDEFLKVYLQVSDMMIAWKNADYQGLSHLSGRLFGAVDDMDTARAVRLYRELSRSFQEPPEIYDGRQIGARFVEEFQRRRWVGWGVEFDEANGGNVSIYETEKKVVVRTGARETRMGLECLICHELDGHACQAFNAMENRCYRPWFLSYLGTERQYEGYAVFVEINNLSIAHVICDVKEYLAFMIGTALARVSSFYHVYREVYGLCRDADFSFHTAYKSKRGFEDTARSGCFQKENAYLMGAMDIVGLVAEDADHFYRLSQGCFPLTLIRKLPKQKVAWLGITAFNRKNWTYFKNIIERIIIIGKSPALQGRLPKFDSSGS